MNKKISFSQLEVFNLCPYKWYCIYIKHLKPQGNLFSAFGSAFHKLLKDVYKTEIFEPDVWIVRWKDYFEKEYLKRRYPKFDKKQIKWHLKRGYPMINNFFKIAKKHDLLKSAIAIEKKLKGKFKGYEVTGILDLIHVIKDKPTVIDYKTGKEKASHKTQLTLYKELANTRRSKNNKIKQCAIWYLPTKKIRIIKEDMRKETAKYINETIEEIERCLKSNQFKKIRNKYCRNCIGKIEGICK